MAQSGYTPLLVYGSSTAAAEPTAPNLTSSANGAELALNYADGKLFYKNSGGNVRLLAIGYGASTVTPTAGGIQYGTGTAVAFTAAGTAGYILQSNGASAPSWVAAPSTSPGGSNTQIQFNNSGSFGGSADVTWTGTNFNIDSTTTAAKWLSFGSVQTLNRNTGGNLNLSLVTIPPNPSNESTTTNITTGGSVNTMKIMGGVNVRGGQIDFVGGSAASNAGTLIFRTGLGGGQSEQTERMRIDSSGNVGIGTSSPSTILHVVGSSSAITATVSSTSTTINGAPSLKVINTGSSTTNQLAEIQFRYEDGTYNGNGAIAALRESGTARQQSFIFAPSNSLGDATERMRITSGGAVCIGTTSASGSRLSTYSTANDTNVYFERNTGATAPTTWPVIIRGQSGGSNSASYAGLYIDGRNGLGNSSGIILGQGVPATYGHHDVTFLQLYGGGLWQSQTYHWSTDGTTTYQGISYPGCEFYNSRSDNQVAFTFYAASTGMNASVVYSRCARTTTNSTYNLFFGTNGNGTGEFAVRDSGNCVNTNNSYGSISDVKLKQDIVDASNQWDDIKNLRIRKFRWKTEVAENPSAKPYLGLIAQEAELVSPGLIEETADYEEFEEDSLDENGNALLKEDGTPHKVRNRRALGTTTKSIKYSILYMKAIKALQEAMERIESLEAKVAALEGN